MPFSAWGFVCPFTHASGSCFSNGYDAKIIFHVKVFDKNVTLAGWQELLMHGGSARIVILRVGVIVPSVLISAGSISNPTSLHGQKVAWGGL